MKVGHFDIEQDAVEPFFKNGYLLSCHSTGRAVYIDPGDEAPRLLTRIQDRQLELMAVILTHAHLDHITGVGPVIKHRKVPIYLHEEDRFLYEALPEQGQWFGFSSHAAPPATHWLEEGQTLTFDCLEIRVHHTPGHSPGSVSLEVENHLFCGDALFKGSIGRTDLPGGSQTILIKSIHSQILPLGDKMILHPGHGPESTVGEERIHNPFLKG